MRNRCIAAYDISDPARLWRVNHKMNGFGEPLQYSVFTCDLPAKERVLLAEALTELITSKRTGG